MFIKIIEVENSGEFFEMAREEAVLSIPDGTLCGASGVYILPPVQCDEVGFEWFLNAGWQIITPKLEEEIHRRVAMRPGFYLV
jgi:hypothetical protein